METRSRSDKDAGSSCFFLGALDQSMKGGLDVSYLNGAPSTSVETPAVVDVEGDQPKDSKIEQYVPSRHEASMIVKPSTPDGGRTGAWFLRSYPGARNLRDACERITMTQLIGKKNPDVEDPSHCRSVASRQPSPNLVVDIKYQEDLDR